MTKKSAARSIERIAMPSRAAFERDFVVPCRPVVITGGMTKWRALSRWSEEYFRTSAVGARVIPIEKYPDGDRYRFPLWAHRPSERMPLRDYIDIALSDANAKYYCASQDVATLLPELWADIERPELFDRGAHRGAPLYLGRDTVSAAHYHPDSQTLLCQVLGKKRFVMWHPDDIDKLYPAAWYTPNFNWSRVDFDAPDLETRYPRLADAKRYECTLEPGDMLFVPVHWWHLVFGDGFSASVGYFWSARLRDWPSAKSALRTLASALVNNPVGARLVPRERLAASEIV